MAILLWLAFVVLAVLKVIGYLAISWWIVCLPLLPIAIGTLFALIMVIALAWASK